jgi:hypothetical protein
MSPTPEEFEQCVTVLLNPENLHQIERIRRVMNMDEAYFFFFSGSTAIAIRRILWASGKGIYIADDAEAIRILREAIRRIPKSSAA